MFSVPCAREYSKVFISQAFEQGATCVISQTVLVSAVKFPSFRLAKTGMSSVPLSGVKGCFLPLMPVSTSTFSALHAGEHSNVFCPSSR